MTKRKSRNKSGFFASYKYTAAFLRVGGRVVLQSCYNIAKPIAKSKSLLYYKSTINCGIF